MNTLNMENNSTVSSSSGDRSTNSINNLLTNRNPTYEDFLAYHDEKVRNALRGDIESMETLEQQIETESAHYGCAHRSREFAMEILTRHYTDVYRNDSAYLLNVYCGNSVVDIDYPRQMDKFDELNDEILQNCDKFNKFFQLMSAHFGRYFVWLKFNADDVLTHFDCEPSGESKLFCLMHSLAPLFLRSRSISSMLLDIEKNIEIYHILYVKPYFMSVTNRDQQSIKAAQAAFNLLTPCGVSGQQSINSGNVETGGFYDDRLTKFFLIFAVIHELFRGDVDFFQKFVSSTTHKSIRCQITNYAMSPLTNFVDRMYFSVLQSLFLAFRKDFGKVTIEAKATTDRILAITKYIKWPSNQHSNNNSLTDRTYLENHSDRFKYLSLNETLKYQYHYDKNNSLDFLSKYNTLEMMEIYDSYDDEDDEDNCCENCGYYLGSSVYDDCYCDHCVPDYQDLVDDDQWFDAESH